jgi:carbamoyl-phosphate synthase small subunit
MKRLYLTLEDGAVFEGTCVNKPTETAGLLSFYTGVVGYQEVITDPANLGKIILFTYPLVGNYGVNNEDAESASVKVRGIITKEYPPYYSNFRATGSLADYLSSYPVVFGTAFDTRAILVYLRDHGEMYAATAAEPLKQQEVRERARQLARESYLPENTPVTCPWACPRLKASVVDLGASRSFYKNLAALGVDACCEPDKADVVIVSDAPFYEVENTSTVETVRTATKGRAAVGFGHGAALLALACGGNVNRMAFGDHGVNIPVAYVGGGRNEITVQNHIYETITGDGIEPIFTNIHDGSTEGFYAPSSRAAGAHFLPPPEWFGEMLRMVGVE